MSLLPDEVTSKTFRRSWRGYDRLQVDAHLRDVATDYGAAIHRVAALAEDRSHAQTDNDALRHELESLSRSARDAAESGPADAERDATTIRQQAEQVAAAIIRQAEEAAAALQRHSETLRSAAQADADAARSRYEDAERRARQTEDAARQRWDVLRTETEQRWERLRAVEHRMNQRIQQADRALAELRSRVAMLDQVDQVEELITAIRADVQGTWTDREPAVDGVEVRGS